MSGVVRLSSDEVSSFYVKYRCLCKYVNEKSRIYKKTYTLTTALEADWPKCPLCGADLSIEYMEYDYS
ncbi:hypothetical protein LCGC14_0855410 [marine sediment metagenome]|uniref:Uncharacterized protein n=1 Tax=marine sediment metagenome TaxID=412755 RepID=A0A0F9P901_9ZZZZ